MRYLLAFLFGCFGPILLFSQESPVLREIVETVARIDRQANLNGTLWTGKHPKRYQAPTWETYEQNAASYQAQIDALQAVPSASLSRQDQISRAVLLLRLQDEVSQVHFRRVLIPFNSEGGFFNEPTYFLSNLPFQTVADYEAYLSWLPSFLLALGEYEQLMRQGKGEKIMASQATVRALLNLMEPWVNKNPSEHPLMKPFSQFPDRIPSGEQARLGKQAQELFTKKILPAYEKLARFTRKEYLPACPEAVGVSALPEGRGFYEDRIRFFTTLDMNSDSVFALGQQEVSRIRTQMEAIIAELSFEGSFADFLTFLRTDDKFYARSPQELLHHAAWLSKKAEGALPPLFSELYELPFTVEPVPDEIAPTYTGGRYVPGNRSQDQPGIYWVNTYDLPSRPLYTLPALSLHEAVPGHHLQIMLAAELQDLPAFRKNYYISAFGEGWGLYAEFLGEEMGMYADPYERFGRYTYEMWRACRLVVDVGLHVKGWSRAQAIQFMSENTALSLHEVETEIDRYIAWPGQAVSYKIGEITIKQLRSNAEAALGEDFDIQYFHQLVLRNGSVPLSILIEEIETYIQNGKQE